MNPVISVIVPFYKVPLDYLRACLESLAAQTLQESEFILVSDGASNAECEICNQYTEIDARFRLLKCDHAGVSTARNHGIKNAKGKYITFVDSDDWVDAEMCKSTTFFAEHAKCDVLIFALNEHLPSKATRIIRPFPHNMEEIEPQNISTIIRNTIHIFNYNLIPTINTVCKIYNRLFLLQNDIKYFDNLPIGEDRVFNYQVYTKAKKIAYQGQPFYHNRLRQTSSRNSYNEQTLHNSFLYINKLKELSQGFYDNEIALEAISEIWFFCSKGPRKRIYLDSIKQAIKSDEYQSFIQGIRKTTPHPLVKLDAFAFKRKWTFPIYIHLLCAWTRNWFKSFF